MSLLSFKGDLPENLGENREFKLYLIRQTSDSSWELFKIENEQIKTAPKILLDKKLGETTNLCVEIMNSRRQVKGKLGHVVQIDVNMMLFFLLFFTWPTLTSQAVFSDNFSDRSRKIRAKKQQFLIANISEILASIELKLHSMFIWFILNTFH